MSAFTIFILNSSLVDNHSTKCERYIYMDGQICSILDHRMDYHIPPGKFFTDITNYLPHIKKFKLMNHLGTGGLELFKVNV